MIPAEAEKRADEIKYYLRAAFEDLAPDGELRIGARDALDHIGSALTAAFLALSPATEATAPQEPRDGYPCDRCGCLWRWNDDGSWSLYDAAQKPCAACDNSPDFLAHVKPERAATPPSEVDDIDTAGRAALMAFVPGTSFPWEQRDEEEREGWRRVVRAVLASSRPAIPPELTRVVEAARAWRAADKAVRDLLAREPHADVTTDPRVRDEWLELSAAEVVATAGVVRALDALDATKGAK